MFRLNLAFIAAIVMLGCGRTLPPPSGSPNDAAYRERRLARRDYSETAIIQACAENSTRCIPAAAELEHHFLSDGQEQVFVERIEIQKGRYINFKEAPLPGRSADGDEQVWRLKW